MSSMTPDTAHFLFPIPSLPPSRLSPGHSPGISPQSTEALQEVLKDNHARWHIFFNEMRFHNHAPHRSLAAWALGADAEAIRRGYEKDCDYEKPLIKAPGAITWENFNDHLGDDRYFAAYMQFLTTHVKEHGIPATLEEFIFSSKANLGPAGAAPEKQPQMLNRFLAGLLHPLIHTGYGVEFGLPGMLVEGLAEAAVHEVTIGLLEPLHLFDDNSLAEKMSGVTLTGVAGGALNRTAEVLGSTVNTLLPKPLMGGQLGAGATNQALSKDTDPHALTILSRVLRDPRFKPKTPGDGDTRLADVVKAHGEQITAYVREWRIDIKQMEEMELWEKKVEEVIWSVVVLYGVAGWLDGKDKEGGFTSDFFLMHHVTSSVFIPSFCAVISARSRVLLLKSYFLVICMWAIARGQPAIDIKAFMRATKNPDKPNSSPSNSTTTNGDVWDKVIEAARGHKDEHLTKTVRSLAAWGSAFGAKKARIPLSDSVKQENGVPKNLAINSADANAKELKRGSGEGGIIAEEPDLSPRSWREWKNGTLPATPPSTSHMRPVMPVDQNGSPKTPTHRRKPSEEVDLSPRAWREAVNHGIVDTHGHEQIPDLELGGALTTSRGLTDDCLPRTEMPGSEYLDGSLFLRVAILALRRAGWDLNAGPIKRKTVTKFKDRDEEFWDFAGFFDQHTLTKAKA